MAFAGNVTGTLVFRILGASKFEKIDPYVRVTIDGASKRDTESNMRDCGRDFVRQCGQNLPIWLNLDSGSKIQIEMLSNMSA